MVFGKLLVNMKQNFGIQGGDLRYFLRDVTLFENLLDNLSPGKIALPEILYIYEDI